MVRSACCDERVPVPLADKYARGDNNFFRISFNKTYGPGLPACDEPGHFFMASPWHVENPEQPLILPGQQYNLMDYKVIVSVSLTMQFITLAIDTMASGPDTRPAYLILRANSVARPPEDSSSSRCLPR